MPPTVEDRLRDVLEAITDIDELVQGATLERFTANRIPRLATERLLEITNIHGRKMIDFGNLLRHAYHTTDVATVSDIVHNELPALKTFVRGKLSSFK